MIIIIDAYNVLKREGSDRQVSHAKRQQFIQLLARYNQRKKYQCYLVFDGGESKWSTKAVVSGIHVIYSGYQYDADSYIKMMVDEFSTKELLLVTSDNQLASYAHLKNVPSIDSEIFYALVTRSIDHAHTKEEHDSGEYVRISQTSSEEIDRIMKEGSQVVPQKHEDRESRYHKKGPHKDAVSKHEKKLVRILEKLQE